MLQRYLFDFETSLERLGERPLSLQVSEVQNEFFDGNGEKWVSSISVKSVIFVFEIFGRDIGFLEFLKWDLAALKYGNVHIESFFEAVFATSLAAIHIV